MTTVVANARAAPASAAPAPDLEEATVAHLQERMANGGLTALSLVQKYLARINVIDRDLNSIIEINPDAEAIAKALDAERKAGHVRGPLHGIPVLLKDNVDTHDRMQTGAGSIALVGTAPSPDSTAPAKLRAPGAVILGKTNLSEWANFRSTHSSSGWSGRGGQCRNPYALDRTPSGSSSGSGVAVAANLCPVAIGTETDGSIVSPSTCCSIVGIKPTLGLVSRSGIVPIAHSQDTAGPMARTVADAAVLLGALTGVDPRDPVTQGSKGRSSSDYTAFLDANGLKGARIGVARTKFFGYHPPTDRLVEEALDTMRRLGAVIVDPADIPHAGEYDDSELEVLLYEFKADLATYLAAWAPGAKVKTLADVIAFNDANKATEMPYFGQELFLQAQEKGPLSDQAYRDALAKDQRLSRTEGLDVVFAQNNLDAIVAPTGSPAWPTDLVNGDHFLGASSTPAAVAGYPSVAVPVG